jgi:hypothetical protein
MPIRNLDLRSLGSPLNACSFGDGEVPGSQEGRMLRSCLFALGASRGLPLCCRGFCRIVPVCDGAFSS